jgi:NAD(P)-dependent dehydrogenase (short-subunit alcohol dehydrogenase family)
VYGAAKAGVIMMTQCAAVEYASSGVRVNAVSPGSMASPGFLSSLDTLPIGRPGYEAQIPQGRLGLAEEIANAVLCLASDESSYVNGITIPVDGAVVAKLASPSTEPAEQPTRPDS